ncbi:ATP-dependent RNA helicase dhx37 [Dermatophagoides farinae]|uniref:RNA helicase n=1 Tax=Dermatophagoides farinae TaxID=6954 RepID=A0A922HQJ4_DERFA|nr:ATP-dependent RNA helicase dhx37 [Dermatophagoides farinae]
MIKQQKIQIEFEVDESKYDEFNPLILSDKSDAAKKEKNIRAKNEEIKKQLLSKKKKKKLEKILERKNRKLNRTNLINDLQQYQIDENEYNSMPSTSIVQTVGKRKINDLLRLYSSINKNDDKDELNERNDDSSRKRFKIRKIKFKNNEKNFNRKDPHIIGFDDNFNTDDDDDDDEQESSSDDEENCDEKIETKNINSGFDQKFEEKNETESKSNEVIESSEGEHQNTKTSKQNQSKIEDDKEVKDKKKSIFVNVDRPEEIQQARQRLPILAEEHNIMDAIMHNQVVIICGETGSGKTTQVPQFLYEAGYATNGKLIGITEPRRVAAISMSKRVACELNMTEKEVSYQIRFEGNVSDKTRIKFMTDGILMKEIERDLYLNKYSALIIDEAHERSLYSDILIGFLSRIVQVRHRNGDPLKLIIMSATLRVEDFTENKHLFKIPPPVIKIDSRQYPVTIHFSKYTNPNYMQEAFKKVCKIHSVSPPGGILVFVTGRTEVLSLVRMLKAKFPITHQIDQKYSNPNNKTKAAKETVPNNDQIIEKSIDDENSKNILNSKSRINLDVYSIDPVETSEKIIDGLDLCDNDSNDDDDGNASNDDDDDEDNEYTEDLGFLTTTEPLYCLPLYSMLPSKKQALVFQPPPVGCRLCVIATNIAETSLTIPNIRYVIDTGKVKNIVYDRMTSVSTFLIDWTSKASADQRSGRAGRTSAGHCYRLYSSAIFNDQFKQYSEPEILKKPIDDLLLQMKAIGFENVTNFPFPTKPNLEALIVAEKLLNQLDALETKTLTGKKNKHIERSKITWFGRLMSYFPVSPRYSRILLLSTQANLVPLVVTLISLLTVQEFFPTDVSKAIKQRRESWFFSHPFCQILGDLWTLLSAFGSAHYHGFSEKFCVSHGLRYNAIREADKLRLQLLNQLRSIMKNQTLSSELSVPNEIQVKMLSKLYLSGFSDHIAKRIPFITVTVQDDNDEVRKVQKSIRNCYQSIEVEHNVFISPHSVMFNQTYDYVVYQEIFESSDAGKMYMRNIVPIQMEWLAIYGAKHCTFSNPLEDPPPRYDPDDDCIKCHRRSTFGPHGWELPAIEVDYPDGLDKYCHFAHFLFDGLVFPSLKANLSYMSSPPILFVKSWAMVQPKVDNVIKCLINNRIDCKHALLNKWKINPKFLLKEYLEWINDGHKVDVRKCWPPC